jgi:hypothetical protein
MQEVQSRNVLRQGKQDGYKLNFEVALMDIGFYRIANVTSGVNTE